MIDKNTYLTVGSTLEESDDEVYLGMLSLLMNTLDRMCNEMKRPGFDELTLKFSDESLLVINISELNLIISAILKQPKGIEGDLLNIKKIKQSLQDLIQQIKELW